MSNSEDSNKSSKPDDFYEVMVKCITCTRTKWIPYRLRFSGRKIPPAGIEQSQLAKCDACPSEYGFTEWVNGRQRSKQ